MVRDLEKENEILVYIDESYSEAEAKSVGSQINLIDNVAKAEFVSREQALDNFVEEQGDATLFDGVQSTNSGTASLSRWRTTAKCSRPLSACRPSKAWQKSRPTMSWPGASAPWSGSSTCPRSHHRAAAGCLLFIISNTVKLAMYDRKEEIAIMKWSARPMALFNFPLSQGFILGAFSAVISFLVVGHL